MKKITILFLALILTLPLNGKELKLGDNLKTEFNKISTPYFYDAPKFTPWVEGQNMLLIGDKLNFRECDVLYLALSDTTLIGAFTTQEPNLFLIDIDSSSIIKQSSDFFLLPFWVVKKNTKISSTDKSILRLLDEMCEKTLQSDELELEKETLLEFSQYYTDTKLPNRHIALLYDNYRVLVEESYKIDIKPQADISVPLMETLVDECNAIFNEVPVIVCIFMGEAYDSAGMVEEAREQFRKSLLLYPNSIPLKFYNYIYEEDLEKKEQRFQELKKKYPNHWMVKKL